MFNNFKRFKKTAVLLIALFAISSGLKAQEWFVMGEYIWSPPNPQGTYELTYACGETVQIDGLEYTTVYLSPNTKLGAFRTEDSQVFYRSWNGTYGEETLLYDYDLEEGDYFNDTDPHPMVVTAVSYITDNQGVQRKMINFEFLGLEDETEFWVEGVGSSKGFINSGNYTPTNTGAIFHLLCYHVGNNLIYVNPEYNTCDITELDENSAVNSINIYPNPAQNTIKVSNADGFPIHSIDIVDLLGRTVISTENTSEINVSSLPEGQYFVKIQGETTIVRKLTISK